MPKNKGKGGKNRKRGKNEADDEKRELMFKEDGQEYAQMLRMLGNGRCEAMCIDGVKRLCHIRGKMHKKVWIAAGDIILVDLREYQDGLGDTIRVSLTEPPEEEIDPCRRLANLGMKASELQKGVAPFEEKNRRYFDFQRRSGQLPLQKEGEEADYRGVLHRDGSVLMSVSLDQCFLHAPELLYKSLAAKLIVGMPFKGLATLDSILLRELPAEDDKDVRLGLKRLIDISMGVITPLSEQLTKPLPNALVMVTLNELSTGAYKLLPEGTRLVVSVCGDESYEELKVLKSTDATMILHDLPYTEEKIS